MFPLEKEIGVLHNDSPVVDFSFSWIIETYLESRYLGVYQTTNHE